MPSSTPKRVLAILVCMSLWVAGAAISQSDENSSDEAAPEEGAISDEITVTARQTEEVLQDVPASVSVLTDTQIEAVGVQRAEDFIKLVPGVSMVNAAERVSA